MSQKTIFWTLKLRLSDFIGRNLETAKIDTNSLKVARTASGSSLFKLELYL